jgi:hypothetical protein
MAKFNVSVYMDSGAIITINCSKFDTKQNEKSNFTKLYWEGCEIALLAFDLNHVIAVTAKEIKG